MELKKIVLTLGILGLLISCTSSEQELLKERTERYMKFEDNYKLADFYEFKTLLQGISETKKDGIDTYEVLINNTTYLINKLDDIHYKKYVSNKIVNFQNDGKIIEIEYNMAVLPRVDTRNIVQGALIFLDSNNRVVQIEKDPIGKVLAKSKTKKILLVPKNFVIGLEKNMIIDNLK